MIPQRYNLSAKYHAKSVILLLVLHFWGAEAGVEAAEPLLTENRQMRGVAWREGAVGRCNTATYGTWGEGMMAGGCKQMGRFPI